MDFWWIWYILGFATATYIWHRLIRKYINIGITYLVHRSERFLKRIDGYEKDED